MNKLVIKIGLAAVVVLAGAGLLYFVFRPTPPEPTRPPEVAPIAKRESVVVPKVVFREISEAAGVRFVHENGADGRKLLPETMGSGCAFLDYDNDGHPDLLLINSRPWPGGNEPVPTMALYRNKGDGTFENVTERVGLNVPLYGQGVCCGDIDNDGWIDIFVSAIGGSKLFRNESGQRFIDITAMAGVSGGGYWPEMSREAFYNLDKPIPWPSSATFLDYDGDGLLDLFVCQYLTWSPKADLDNKFTLDGTTRGYGRPQQFIGTHCWLYRNVKGTRFEDVSVRAGIQVFDREGIGPDARVRPAAKALGVIVCDPDEDGWPDIVVANDTVRNFFFHNVPDKDGSRRFEEKGSATGLALAEGNARGGMGIDWAEFLPGLRAIQIANFANEPTTFFCQDRPKRLRFADLAVAVGISGPTLGPLKFGTFFFDYDLDGRLDILTNNGHLEPEIEKVQAGQKYAQAPQLFWNTGRRSGCFEPVTAEFAGSDLFVPIVGRGSAFADIDGDGDLDIILMNNGGPVRLLRNDNELKNHWIRLVLEGDGKRSNRSAIGATVTLEAGGRSQTQVVTSGRGYLSQCELALTFGLGQVATVDRVTIRWPGRDAGEPTVLTNLAIDQVHRIKQP
jgi:hypothetical protein